MTEIKRLNAAQGEIARAVRRFQKAGFRVHVVNSGAPQVLIYDERKEYLQLDGDEARYFLKMVQGQQPEQRCRPEVLCIFVATAYLEQHLQLALDLSE